MYINRKVVALVVLWLSIIVMHNTFPSFSYVLNPDFPIEPKVVQAGIFLSISAALTWLNWRILKWIEQPKVQPQERVERLLSQLDNEDIDLLRERLTAQEADLFVPDKKQKRFYKETES
jgi:hypothetical protein